MNKTVNIKPEFATGIKEVAPFISLLHKVQKVSSLIPELKADFSTIAIPF